MKKTFYGLTMKITPRSMIVPPFELEADWDYDFGKKVWIANGTEYSEEICEVKND